MTAEHCTFYIPFLTISPLSCATDPSLGKLLIFLRQSQVVENGEHRYPRGGLGNNQSFQFIVREFSASRKDCSGCSSQLGMFAFSNYEFESKVFSFCL